MRWNTALAWIKALRSGKYPKGKGQLRTLDGKYCCLGIYCKIRRINPLYLTDYSGINGLTLNGWSSASRRLRITNDDLNLTIINDEYDTFDPVIDFIKQNWRHL